MAIREKLITKLDSHSAQQYNAYMKRRQKRKKRLFRRLALFSIIVFVIIGSMTTYHIKQRILQAEMKEKYGQLENQLATLQEQEKDLQEEVSLLNNDEYVLEIARSNYFFSKEGELIFKIAGDEATY